MKVALIILVLFANSLLFGATITVVNTNDAGAGSLREAVITSVNGDDIRFSPTLLATGNATILLLSEIAFNKSISITGLYNANDTLYLSGGNANRIFNISTTQQVTLDSLYFINGYSTTTGGGVNCSGVTDFYVLNCFFRNNNIPLPYRGGGLFYVAASNSFAQLKSIHLQNTKFYENSSQYGGGFASTCPGQYPNYITITDCLFEQNNGLIGGAIFFDIYSDSALPGAFPFKIINSVFTGNSATSNAGTVGFNSYGFSSMEMLVLNSKFSNNSSNSSGGAILYSSYSRTDAKLRVEDCEFIENTASGSGAISSLYNSNFQSILRTEIVNCTFSKNTTQSGSAAIGNFTSATSPIICELIVEQCTFDGNQSLGPVSSGSAIYLGANNASLSIKNSTFTNNKSPISNNNNTGGAVHVLFANNTLEIESSIIAFNTPRNIINNGLASLISNGYNIFSDNTLIGTVASDQIGVDSTQLKLNNLNYNGGNTQTRLPLVGSVAINTGNPSDLVNAQNAPITGIRDAGAAETCFLSRTEQINSCIPYQWIDGVTYSASTDSAFFLIPNVNGCDSVIFLNLTLAPINAPVQANTTSDTICLGEIITLTGSSASTYVWNNGVIDNVPFSPTSTRFYSVTGTNIGGCFGVDSIQIVVNSLPNVLAESTDSVVCLGSTTSVFGSGAQSYSWSNNVLNANAFAPTATTQYTVTGTDANGCQNIDSVEITVNNSPTIVANASATIICEGDSTLLFGSGGNTYTWNLGAVDNDSVSPNSTATYTVIGTDLNGCLDSANVTVQVNTNPSVLANATNDTICLGEIVTLFGSAASTYSWNNSVTDNVPFSPTSTRFYRVTGTNIGGCFGVDSIQIVVNSLPNVLAESTDSVVCLGSTTSVFGSGAQSYSWSNNVLNANAFAPTATTQYTVTGMDANGCQNIDSVEITVNNSPTIIANASATIICEGDSTLLFGSGGNTYTWNLGAVDNDSVSPNSTATYTVIGTDLNGCLDSANVTVQVNANPNVLANATNDTICLGEIVTLFGSAASTYSWNNGATDNVPFSPSNSIFYTVLGTDLNGCFGVDSIQIVVNSLPNVQANTSSSVICQGSSTLLFGTGANSYTWNLGVTNNDSVSPISTTTYSVTGTDINGCQNSSFVSIVVHPNPIVSINTSVNAICFGESITLSGSGALNYFWSNGVANNVSFIPNSTTTYAVLGSDANNCFDTASVTITVNPLPNVVANATDLFVCEGESTTLFGSGALSYTWNNGINDGIAFAPSTSTNYTVTGIDANNCVNSDDLFLSFFPTIDLNIGEDDTICSQKPKLLSTGNTYQNYLWSTGATSPEISVNFGGTISLTVEDANGCNYTDEVTIYLSDDCFPELFIPSSFTPNGDEHNNVLRTTGNQLTYFEINIFNRWGNLLYSSFDMNQHWDGTFNGQPCPEGIYIYSAIYSVDSGTDEKFTKNGHVTLLR